VPSGQIKDQSPWCDAVPGPFTGAVLVAEERRLDAGLDAVQAMLASLGRSGALIASLVVPETTGSISSASHHLEVRNDVVVGRGQHGPAG
jgi:hypothetical protein